MVDEHIVPEDWRRIAFADDDAVFAHGGCFLFAQRLRERFGFSIRGFRLEEKGPWTHVWARRDEKLSIDIRGIYPEELLAQLANSGNLAPSAEDLSDDDLAIAIAKKAYPPDLLKEMRRLADLIVDSHERFQGVKPLNPGEYEAFVADVEQADKEAQNDANV